MNSRRSQRYGRQDQQQHAKEQQQPALDVPTALGLHRGSSYKPQGGKGDLLGFALTQQVQQQRDHCKSNTGQQGYVNKIH
jgi:hypothetical protein